MKKNIDYINLDSSLAGWLDEKLGAAPPEAVGAEELRKAIKELASGETSTLMLEMGDMDGRETAGREAADRN